MDQVLNTLNGFTNVVLPLSAASDTMGLYTIVPKTVQNLMKNPFVQFFVLYYFLLASGAQPRFALMLVVGMCVLLYLEKTGLVQPLSFGGSD